MNSTLAVVEKQCPGSPPPAPIPGSGSPEGSFLVSDFAPYDLPSHSTDFRVVPFSADGLQAILGVFTVRFEPWRFWETPRTLLGRPGDLGAIVGPTGRFWKIGEAVYAFEECFCEKGKYAATDVQRAIDFWQDFQHAEHWLTTDGRSAWPWPGTPWNPIERAEQEPPAHFATTVKESPHAPPTPTEPPTPPVGQIWVSIPIPFAPSKVLQVSPDQIPAAAKYYNCTPIGQFQTIPPGWKIRENWDNGKWRPKTNNASRLPM